MRKRKNSGNTAARETSFLRVLLENTSDVLKAVNDSGIILYVTPSVQQLLGYLPEEMVNKKAVDFVHSDDRTLWEEALMRARQTPGRATAPVEMRALHKDGSWRYMERIVKFLDSPADKAMFVINIRDVTSRRLMEQSLAESENKLRFLAEELMVGLYMLQDGILEYTNPQFAEIFGYKPGETTGMKLADFVFNEDLPLVKENIRRRESGEVEAIRYEFRCITRSGKVINVEVYGRKTVYQGKPAIIGNLLDITDRKRTEERLRESEQRYRYLTENTKDLFWVMDARSSKMIYLSPNEERFNGFTNEETVGKSPLEFVTPESAAVFMDNAEKATEAALAGQPFGVKPFEVELIRKDGSTMWIEASMSANLNKEGAVATIQGVSRDISERKEAEKALRESEQLYRLLADNMTDMVTVWDINSLKFLYLSPSAEKFFGYSVEELLKLTIPEVLPPEYVTPLQDYITFTLKAAEADSSYIPPLVETPIARKDGSMIWIEATCTYIRDDTGAITAGQTVNRDINERKKLENKLRASEEQYRLLAENTVDVVWVMDARSQKLRYLSPSMEKFLGYPVAEMLEKDPTLYMTPASGALFREYVSKAAKAAVSGIILDIKPLELILIRKDGSNIWVETTLNVNMGQDGLPVSVQGLSRNISERKRTEKIMRESEERYRLLADNMNDLVTVWDVNSLRFLYASPSAVKFTGYSVEELLNMTVDQMIPEEYVTQVKEIVASTIKNKKAGNSYSSTFFETPVIRKDGSVTWNEATFSWIYDDTGAIIAGQTVNRDITERKKAEEELALRTADLARSNAELEHFAYIASHDLQEPLRMVASFTELLARRYKGKLDSDADEFIAFAVDGANRMKQLINDLLAYSRVGTRVKPFAAVDCRAVLKHVLTNLSELIKNRQVTVTVATLPTIMGDEVQLTQLFQNIIANAVKFSGEQPPVIKVSACRQDREWIFSVSDNGIGINQQHFATIFEIFQRVHSKKNYPGTGLGLAICKKIVERHGGRIWVTSELGCGSTFSFTLPRLGGL